MTHTERRTTEIIASKLLDRCVVLLREYLGEQFDSLLVRVLYRPSKIWPWCISIGTEKSKCLLFSEHTPEEVYALFASVFPTMASDVKKRGY